MTDAVDYAVALHRRNSDALGFIPRSSLRLYDEKGQLLLELENGEPCGYLVVGGSTTPVLRIAQACIQYDARRREHGRNLVDRAVEVAVRHGQVAIGLRCADGLEANDFWRAMGFRFLGSAPGGSHARGRRTINRWWLPVGGQPTLGL